MEDVSQPEDAAGQPAVQLLVCQRVKDVGLVVLNPEVTLTQNLVFRDFSGKRVRKALRGGGGSRV